MDDETTEVEESVTTVGKKKSRVFENHSKENTVRHSADIMKAFYPIHLSLMVLGRLPFLPVKKANGAHVFRFKRLSPLSIYFVVVSIIFGILFILSITGFVAMYFNYGESKLTNRCGATWENFNLKRTTVPTALTVSWMFLTLAGSYVIFTRGREYIHYMNFWNRAVAVLDMNPTEGARKGGIIDIAQFAVVIVVFILLYSTKAVPSLHDGAGSVSNSIVRLFVQDIGISEEFNKRISTAGTTNCTRDKYFSVDYESTNYRGLKLLGFFIQIYTMYGSWCSIIQFRFYCRLLRNVSRIWNERFKNALHGAEEVYEDQETRRMQLRLLMKDHLIIVQLFKLTESGFSTILNTFYAVQIANLCCELYFLSGMKGGSSCEAMLINFGEENKAKIMKVCLGMKIDFDISTLLNPSSDKNSLSRWFDDPCAEVQDTVFQEAILALLLLIQTLRITFSTTMQGSLAYEEAMKGFSILRRHSYMYCKNRKERNFMHSLIFSFARNNPMQVSAGNYFVVNKSLIAIISGAIFTYYIILLQFQPGEFDSWEFCQRKICRAGDMSIGNELFEPCNATGSLE